jgi:hypothetical protein
VAYLAYRRGEVERADSLFHWAFDRFPPELLRRLEDPSPVLGGPPGPDDPPDSPERRAAIERLWAALDPDPTTPQNELRLELWSRVTHAWLLLDDPTRPGPDARLEVYARYGAPKTALLNPPGVPLFTRYWNYGLIEMVKHGGNYIDPMEFSLNALVMSYPDLGMRVVLQDRSLQGRFEWPLDLFAAYAKQVIPDRARLVRRDDLMAIGDGYAVFPKLPPREQRIEVRGALARFEGERGPRLFAQANAPAAPGEALTAVWVVRDSSGAERLRQEQALVTSACDPSGRRIAELNVALPPGAFDVAVSVRDGHHRRGLYRVATELPPPSDSLALSDVVLTCGTPGMLTQGSSIRIEADREARVAAGAPAVAYFEIYRLAPGRDGLAHYEHTFVVRRLRETAEGSRKAERAAALASTSATREETQPGTSRRQFVTVPAQSLTPGHYRLEIRVRDRVSGRVANGEVEFDKD